MLKTLIDLHKPKIERDQSQQAGQYQGGNKACLPQYAREDSHC